MPEDSELLFESTAEFESDMKALPPPQRHEVVETVNSLGTLFAEDRARFRQRARALRGITVSGEFQSSLYVARIRNLRVIFSADDDPALRQVVITLLAVASRASVYDRWSAAARKLYGEDFREEEGS